MRCPHHRCKPLCTGALCRIRRGVSLVVRVTAPGDSPFLAACRGDAPTHVPVWFMRQAGRSLPEYRALRGEESLLDSVRSPERAAELTCQPVNRLGVDAAILFSDIMVPIAAVGFGVELRAGVGPVIEQPFAGRSDLHRLRPLEPEADIGYVAETVRILTRDLRVPLIGFAGGPFTLASYMIEGGPSRDHAKTKAFMYNQPVLWAELLERLADNSLAALAFQIEAGADAIQVFDSWIGAIGPSDYLQYVMPATRRIFEGLTHFDVPRIHFGVGTGELLELMGEAGADVVGVDWRVPLDTARVRIGGGRSVQGNLDPVALLAGWDATRHQAERILREGGGKGHIFNLGHGVLPSTDPGVLAELVGFCHDWSPTD